jgi:hypothetical protein
MQHCAQCDDQRWVCENHPDRPAFGPRACECGAGMPCLVCNRADASNPPAMPPGYRPDPLDEDLGDD